MSDEPLFKFQVRRIDQTVKQYSGSRRFVLVAKEKHATRYLDASSPDALFRSCLALVRERDDDGWYYTEDGVIHPDMPSISRELTETLPPGPVHDAAENVWRVYEKQMDQAEQKKVEALQVKTILETKDGKRAYLFLMDRREGEYEYIILKEIETFKDEEEV